MYSIIFWKYFQLSTKGQTIGLPSCVITAFAEHPGLIPGRNSDMKFLATSAASVTSAAIHAEGKACRIDDGSVRRHNGIARCRCRTKRIDDVIRLRHIGKLKLCRL